ncbi:hypothetical protein EGW08_000149, partial [Elysia chlorotica]
MDIYWAMKNLCLLVELCLFFLGECVSAPAIRYLEPEFVPSPATVSYKRGENARLYCSVMNLGELTVSWRRVTAPATLTVGTMTWINDPRIKVDHVTGSDQWDLLIDSIDAT